jgi:hypothetical protein
MTQGLFRARDRELVFGDISGFRLGVMLRTIESEEGHHARDLRGLAEAAHGDHLLGFGVRV